jgi:membrane-associated protease RseP (regulator of RpoE activity)
MKQGDRVVDVDGRVPTGELEIRAILEKSAKRSVPITVERASQRHALTITPVDEGGKGKIGVLFADGNRVHRELTVGQAFGASWTWMVDTTDGIFMSLGKLFKGEISPRAFSGPIEIARFSREAVRGLQPFSGAARADQPQSRHPQSVADPRAGWRTHPDPRDGGAPAP